MAVFKVEKRKNYTIMSNHHLQNKNLSLKAKGLLSYMLSLPEDWDYSLAGLEANCKESKTALTTALNELKANGYVKIEKMYPNQTKSKKIVCFFSFLFFFHQFLTRSYFASFANTLIVIVQSAI